MRYRLRLQNGRVAIAKGPGAALAFLYGIDAYERVVFAVEPLSPEDPAPGGHLATFDEGEE